MCRSARRRPPVRVGARRPTPRRTTRAPGRAARSGRRTTGGSALPSPQRSTCTRPMFGRPPTIRVSRTVIRPSSEARLVAEVGHVEVLTGVQHDDQRQPGRGALVGQHPALVLPHHPLGVEAPAGSRTASPPTRPSAAARPPAPGGPSAPPGRSPPPRGTRPTRPGRAAADVRPPRPRRRPGRRPLPLTQPHRGQGRRSTAARQRAAGGPHRRTRTRTVVHGPCPARFTAATRSVVRPAGSFRTVAVSRAPRPSGTVRHRLPTRRWTT